MIVTFGDKTTEDVFHGMDSKHARRLPQNVVTMAVQKLDMINAASTLQDLRSPPSNHLEQLKGSLKGMHSIRVNMQYRIVFIWQDGMALEVQIVDYH
ncbi:MAG: type II toxin-antitoxin system RelE/ParE family toxin [Ignavibacteriae bacterium]|nr:MAG: type II toxin-antitoxin system RelE/ParE family toxin [Ignavibacteriota bacterium]